MRLRPGISNTNMRSSARTNNLIARWGDGLESLGTGSPIGLGNMGLSHDFLLLRPQLAERSGCRVDLPLLQFQLLIVRRRQPPRH